MHSRPRRGVAMLMVLSAVAAAAILSWAMLSAASMRSQISVNVEDSVEANNLAESGVSYALYYLRYPAKSPIALMQGAFNSHYPGQAGLRLWSDARGTVDVVVTNTAQDAFTIRSTSTVDGMKQTVEADAYLVMQGFQITSASGINGPFSVPNSMTINGQVVAKGVVSGATSNISNSTPPVATGNNVVPTADEVALLLETAQPATGTGAIASDRTYHYRGKTYFAERVTGTMTGTVRSRDATLNPLNVWYSDGNVTMSNCTLEGTLVMRNPTGVLTATGTNTITNKGHIASLVAANRVDLSQSLLVPSRLTVNGAAWIGNKIRGTGVALTTGHLRVNGSLMFGGGETRIESFSSPIEVTYTSFVASVTNLSTVRTVGGINVTRWQKID